MLISVLYTFTNTRYIWEPQEEKCNDKNHFRFITDIVVIFQDPVYNF